MDKKSKLRRKERRKEGNEKYRWKENETGEKNRKWEGRNKGSGKQGKMERVKEGKKKGQM